ncbi:DNA repair helicase [Ostertagia ostertagi]
MHAQGMDIEFRAYPMSTITQEAKDMISGLLRVNVAERLTAKQCLMAPWMNPTSEAYVKQDMRKLFRQSIILVRFFCRLQKYKYLKTYVDRESLRKRPFRDRECVRPFVNYSECRIDVDGLEVLFPYDYVYPEQVLYMQEVKKAIDAQVGALPSGNAVRYGEDCIATSLVVAYMRRFLIARYEALIFRLYAIQWRHLHLFGCCDVCSEKFLCINNCKHRCSKHRSYNAHVGRYLYRIGSLVDGGCQRLTASFVRARRQFDPSIPACSFFETLNTQQQFSLPPGIYNLSDLKQLGRDRGICPYFVAREAIRKASIVVYSYHYILDPKIAELVSKDFSRRSCVVFDEAHNIDNVCIESMSITITQKHTEKAAQELVKLESAVQRMKSENSERLQNEYEKLVEGLRRSEQERANDERLANPVLPDAILHEAVPGSIRTAQHFVMFMKRVVEYVRHRMRSSQVLLESPAAFVKDIQDRMYIDRKPLRFCAERLDNLTRTLEVADASDFRCLSQIAILATLVSTYSKGFSVIIEPSESNQPAQLTLSCMDASIAIRPVMERFQTVVITSGTLSPLEMYPKILDFDPAVMASLTMTLARPCLSPLVVARGNDQVAMTSRFEQRNDVAVIRNYGNLVLEMAAVVPDGMVVFFTSYVYMEQVIAVWYDQHVIDELMKSKLLFIETNDALETSVALEKYVDACDSGRGACLFSVARGKVSEGIDFSHHLERMTFSHLTPMRHTAQCMGRALRGKTDYGLMIFADKRFSRQDKRGKLPRWMQEYLETASTNLSIDEAVQLARRWLTLMAQPFTKADQLGISLLTSDMLNPKNMKKFEKVVEHVD